MAHHIQSRPRPPSAVPRSPPLGQHTPPFPSAVMRPSPGRQLRDPRPLIPRPSCDHFPLSRRWSCHCRLARSPVPLGRNVIPPLSAGARFRPRRPARVCWSEARRPVSPPQGQGCAPRPPLTPTPRDSPRSRGCIRRSSLTSRWLAKPRPWGTLLRPLSTVVTSNVRCHDGRERSRKKVRPKNRSAEIQNLSNEQIISKRIQISKDTSFWTYN